MAIDYTTLLSELANFENAGVYINDIIQDPDKVLRDRGESSEILNDVLSDDQVTQAVISRKNRVLLSKKYAFRAGSPEGEKPDERAEALKNALVKDLERANMTEVISSLLDAPFWGFSVVEVIWESAGLWRIKDLKPRPSYWFKFDKDGLLCFTGAQSSTPKPVPQGKFILARHSPSYENPYGIRLLSRCLWPVVFKKGGIKLYAYFAERYGLPFIHGVGAEGATDSDLEQGAAKLAKLRAGGVTMTGSGTQVNMLTAGTQGNDVYEQYLNRWDAAISKVIMGQTLTAELSGDTGSFAAAETHKGVAGDIADADRAIVTQAMNELAYIYTKINSSSAAAPIFEYENVKDLLSRAELDNKLYTMGVEFEADYIEKTYGIDKTLFKVTPKQQGGTVMGFAKAKEATAVVQAENLEDKAVKSLEELTGLDASSFEKVKDLNDLEDVLLASELPEKDIERIVGEVLVNGFGKGFTHIKE